MRKTTCMLIVALIAAAPPVAVAGNVVWIASISIYSNPDPSIGQSIYSSPITGNGFGISDFNDPRTPGSGGTYWAVVDFTGPTMNLGVTYATWNQDVQNGYQVADVPFSVFSYPASLDPPNITALPSYSRSVGDYDIPEGNYTAAPLMLTFSGGGNTALLFETYASILFGPPQISFTFGSDPDSVPEPSSIVILATAPMMVFWIRRRSLVRRVY